MKVNFKSNTLVFQTDSSENFVIINLTYMILAFCINEKFIAIIEDWEHLSNRENLHIYDLKGNFLFNVKPAPKDINGIGYYSSIGFESSNILILQSNDYRYKFDLLSREFIDEEFTK